jgi:hypothetical protein
LKNAKVCKSTTKEKTSKGLTDESTTKEKTSKGLTDESTTKEKTSKRIANDNQNKEKTSKRIANDNQNKEKTSKRIANDNQNKEKTSKRIANDKNHLFIIIFVFYDIIPIFQITQLYLNHKIPKTVFKGVGLNTQASKTPFIYHLYKVFDYINVSILAQNTL